MMRIVLWATVVMTALPGVAVAAHALPRGGYVNGEYNGANTLVIEPSAFEVDSTLATAYGIGVALADQGYDTDIQHHLLANCYGYMSYSTVLTIDQCAARISAPEHPVRILVAIQHGDGANPRLAWELYSYTDDGKTERNSRYNELGRTYRLDDEVYKADRYDPDHPYRSFYGIAVRPAFFRKILTDQNIPGPDIFHIAGCNTASSGWENLITDAGVRCLVLMADTVVAGVCGGPKFEITCPWTRMNGRHWDGTPVGKRLRTAPLAFDEPFNWNGKTYLVRDNPPRPLWEVHMAQDVDSMALSPTLVSVDLAQNTTIGQNPVWEDAVFSCPMWRDYPGRMIRSTGGAYVDTERWLDDHTLSFRVRSVKLWPWSEVVLRGENDPYKHLCSAEGYRSVCFSGHGPVSPFGHDSTIVVNCTYSDPNPAAAYDGVSAWRDNGQVKVWVEGTEVGTTRHAILAGETPGSMHEVGSIPGSGINHYEIDQLVTIPEGNVVQVVEEPDGSASRVTDVLPSEPPEHVGHFHRSHPETRDLDSHGCCRTGLGVPYPPDNTWVIYGPPALVAAFQASGGPELLTRQGLYPDYVTSGSHDGWDLHNYITLTYPETHQALPRGATILGSGRDSTASVCNDISPYKYPCNDCYWHSWQSGDVMWGVGDNFF